MKLAVIPFFLICFAAMPRQASATPVVLGLSNQIFTLTGIGPNSSGDGQSTVSWGTCTNDGINTTCTLSGSFTGIGNGGTYSFVVTYPGNGPFPLIAVTAPGSNFFTYQSIANFSLVITLAETGGPTVSFYSFANFEFFYTGSATCTGLSVTNCAVGQVGQTQGATITGNITGNFDPTPTITASGVITAGDYGGFQAIAPATWIEIYGVNLATTRGYAWEGSDFNGNQAPDALAGTTVTVAGIPAFINYVSPAQVDVQVPSGVPSGSQSVVVTTAGGTSLAYTVTVNALEPGLLAPPAFMINGKQNVVALFSGTLRYVLPSAIAGVLSAPAKSGDNITLYGIGFGPVTPTIDAGLIVQETNALQAKLEITFAGTPATITYAGLAPGYVGLYQINLVVPTVTSGNAVPLAFTLNGAAGPQNLVIAVQN
jgi:uncharacterized protein (TIGR03437 family)